MTLGVVSRIDAVIGFGRVVIEQIRTKEVPFMAGSIAYAAFVSLLPLLVLVILVASVAGGQLVVDYLLSATSEYLNPTGQQLITNSVNRAIEQRGLSILGLVVLLWGGLRIFRGLDTAFSIVYGTQRENDLVNQIQDGVVVLTALLLALVLMVLASVVLSLFPRLPFVRLWNAIFLIVGLTIAFLPIYYVFPDTRVSVLEVLPGAFVAAVGWAALDFVFHWYVAYSATGEVYGFLGAVVLFVTWLYFGAFVLLVGAVINAIQASRPSLVSAQADSTTS